jgi:two-component system, OmpR family, sensor kinase
VSSPNRLAGAPTAARRGSLPATTRVALGVTAVLAAGVLLFSVIAFTGVSGRISSDVDRTLRNEADAYRAALSIPSVAPAATASSTAMLINLSRSYLSARTGPASGVRPILVIRFAGGKVLSNSPIRLEAAPANAAILDPARAARRFATVRFSGALYRVATVPIETLTGQRLAVFEAALALAPYRSLSAELAATLAAAGLAVVVLGAIISAWVARATLAPLRKVAARAAGITYASLDERLQYGGPPDEIGALVSAINAMLDRLEAAFGEQRRFVADASHELRTPLAIVRGHLELLARPDLDEEERRESIQMALDEADRMNRMIGDLLALARLEAARPRRQDLEVTTLVAESAARAEALADVPIRAECNEMLWVRADPDQLLQAFLNLLSNATRHSPAGAEVRISCRRAAGEVIVEVADSGPGIAPEDVERIFDRFYRGGPSRSTGQGAGLGLAITKRLVELQGGTVRASRAPEGGALFSVALPVSTPTDL